MESNKIQSALEYWHSRLSQECGEDHILNITLYGSQNYNIDTPYSDVDVKAIYVPSLADAVLENKWTSFEFHNIQNEHCELKDIREMFNCFRKQNINFLEILSVGENLKQSRVCRSILSARDNGCCEHINYREKHSHNKTDRAKHDRGK